MDQGKGKQQKKMLDSLRDHLISTSRDPAVENWKKQMTQHEESRYNRTVRRWSSTTDLSDSDFPVFGGSESVEPYAPMDSSRVFVPTVRGKLRKLDRRPRVTVPSDSSAEEDSLSASLPDMRQLKIGKVNRNNSLSSNTWEDSDMFATRKQSIKDSLQKMGVKPARERPKYERVRTGSGEELMLMKMPHIRKGSLNTRNVRRLSLKRGSVSSRSISGLHPITEKSSHSIRMKPATSSDTPIALENKPKESVVDVPRSRRSSISLETTTQRLRSRQDSEMSTVSATSTDTENSAAPRKRRKSLARSSSSRSLLSFPTVVTVGGKLQSLANKKKQSRRTSVASLKNEQDWKKHLRFGNKFRRLCKFFCVLYRTWQAHSAQVADILQSFESLDALIDIEDDKQKLMFDVSDYKAHREAKISQDARRILQMPAATRNEKDLHYLKIALRNYSTIVEYPVHMQKLLAERAWYEGYDAKRVLLREGHPPWNFYFILSGSVIVSVYDKEKSINKTVCFLNRGDSFGEVSLRNKHKRETTVISKEKIELLVISDKDFFDIFMSGGLGNPKDPFLRSIPYLKGWPLKRLGENPKKATFSFFKRGTILIKDSTKSDWIYIIKSGSCSVLKKLKFVSPDLLTGTKRSEPVTEKDKPEKEEKHLSHEELLQQIMQCEVQKMERTSTWHKHMNQPEINVSTSGSYIKTGKDEKGNTVLIKGDDDIDVKAAKVEVVEEPPKLEKEKTEVSSTTHHDKTVHLQSSAPVKIKPNSIPRITFEDEKVSPEDALDHMLASITEERQAAEMKAKKVIPLKEQDMFVTVQTLTKGSVFGLADLVYGRQPVFSVVSNGAEIIMIQKKFYQDHVDQTLETKLREEIYPFPTDDVLQEKLKTTINWEFNRRHAMETTLNRLKFENANVNDARSTLGFPMGT